MSSPAHHKPLFLQLLSPLRDLCEWKAFFQALRTQGVNGGEPRSTDFPSILSEPLGGPIASTQCLGKESKSFCPVAPSILGNGVCAQPGFNSPEKWTVGLRPCSLENTEEGAHTQAELRERGESPSRFGLLNALPVARSRVWRPLLHGRAASSPSCSPSPDTVCSLPLPSHIVPQYGPYFCLCLLV